MNDGGEFTINGGNSGGTGTGGDIILNGGDCFAGYMHSATYKLNQLSDYGKESIQIDDVRSALEASFEIRDELEFALKHVPTVSESMNQTPPPPSSWAVPVTKTNYSIVDEPVSKAYVDAVSSGLNFLEGCPDNAHEGDAYCDESTGSILAYTGDHWTPITVKTVGVADIDTGGTSIDELEKQLQDLTSKVLDVESHGELALWDGAPCIPSLSFSGDHSTGLYRSGWQELGISCGGRISAIFDEGGIRAKNIDALESRLTLLENELMILRSEIE